VASKCLLEVLDGIFKERFYKQKTTKIKKRYKRKNVEGIKRNKKRLKTF